MRRFLLLNISSLLLLQAFNLKAQVEPESCHDFETSIAIGVLPEDETIENCSSEASDDELLFLVRKSMEFRAQEHSLVLLQEISELDSHGNLIHLAALYELPNTVEFLINAVPNFVEVLDEAGRTPLTSAALGRSYMSAKILLDHGASVDIGESMIVSAARSREIAYLIAARDKTWVDDRAITGQVLGAAVQFTDEAFLQFLLSLGLGADLTDENDHSVLLYAAHHNDPGIGERNWIFLLRNGAQKTKAICALDMTEVENAKKFAPKWFAKEVTDGYSNCR